MSVLKIIKMKSIKKITKTRYIGKTTIKYKHKE